MRNKKQREAGSNKLTISCCLAATSRASFSAALLSSRMQTSQVQNSKSSCSWAWACRFMRRLRRANIVERWDWRTLIPTDREAWRLSTRGRRMEGQCPECELGGTAVQLDAHWFSITVTIYD